MLTIALSKGRILDQTLPLLEKAGLSVSKKELESRKLILDTNLQDIKVIVIRASDVPVFVQHGAADLGIAGKDVLIEHLFLQFQYLQPHAGQKQEHHLP